MRLLLLLPALLSALIAVSQEFTTFDFSSAEQKKNLYGDTTFFTIQNGYLQSTGPADKKAISVSFQTQTPDLNLEWEILCRMEFNPTSSNYARIYLASDQQDLNGPLKGFYLKMGGASGNTDAVDLYRQNGNTHTRILQGKAGICGKSVNNIRVKVSYSADYLWKVALDSLGGWSFLDQGQVKDTSAMNLHYSGVSCIYSSTRSQKFFFDDFSVKPGPSQFSGYKILNEKLIQLSFTGKIKKKTFTSECFTLPDNSIENISTDSTLIILSLKNPIKKINDLIICPVEDIYGHWIPQKTVRIEYSKPLSKRSVVINEILPDPSPAEGLPEYEFAEIINLSHDTIDTGNLIFTDKTTIGRLAPAYILPGEYVILCSGEAAPLFKSEGKVISVTPWPSLNNSDDILYLRDSSGTMIDSLFYRSDFYSSSEKKNGGWSLEQVNPLYNCKGPANWTESTGESGGTPGKENSARKSGDDIQGPQVIRIESVESDFIRIILDENPVPGFNVTVNKSIAEFILRQDSLLIYSTGNLFPGQWNQVRIQNIYDCLGNINTVETEILVPDKIEKGDILISEILFNPRTYGTDFLELFNRSGKTLSLKGIEIENTGADGKPEKIMIEENILISPGSFIAITEDSVKISEHYPLSERLHVFEIKNLPSFDDDQGFICVRTNGISLDSMHYAENYHSPLLNDKDGVSLERISFDFPSDTRSTWHSAAQPPGFATPGYENSQHTGEKAHNDQVEIDPPVFSPDLDGYNDFTIIRLRNIETGYKGSIRIYDLKGRLVRILENNILLPDKYAFEWDGTTMEGEKAATGIYLININMFNARGETKEFRETVAVAGKF
jgi:hypothetical protein